jgi:hypothetical protein
MASVMAQLDKPATIQELRQLMTAISIMETIDADIDINHLIFTYITKDTKQHNLLLKYLENYEGKYVNNDVINAMLPSIEKGLTGKPKIDNSPKENKRQIVLKQHELPKRNELPSDEKIQESCGFLHDSHAARVFNSIVSIINSSLTEHGSGILMGDTILYDEHIPLSAFLNAQISNNYLHQFSNLKGEILLVNDLPMKGYEDISYANLAAYLLVIGKYSENNGAVRALVNTFLTYCNSVFSLTMFTNKEISLYAQDEEITIHITREKIEIIAKAQNLHCVKPILGRLNKFGKKLITRVIMDCTKNVQAVRAYRRLARKLDLGIVDNFTLKVMVNNAIKFQE